MLHLGHAYSAIVAHDLARERGGRFLLRIEDIDGARSRPELAAEFRRDLEWLGLEWDEVPAQSSRLASYEEAAGDPNTALERYAHWLIEHPQDVDARMAYASMQETEGDFREAYRHYNLVAEQYPDDAEARRQPCLGEDRAG